MIIHVKLMGMLKSKTPDGGTLELPDGTTIHDALVQLQIDPGTVQAFSINGSIERDLARELADQDEFMVLPPVGGG